MSLAKNVDYLRGLPKLNGFADFGRTLKPGQRSPLVETKNFGSNPGALRMFTFAPDNLQPAPGLVVVLHGCGQSAAAYDLGAGWSTLAKHYGFALLMPQQQPFNNANGCFNWFNREDTARDRGEAGSIRQMIARAVKDIGIDRERIFVTGLSAGGAMTSVMLATYPEIFAGGAVIAGLPFGVATNMREALSGMFQSPSRPASELGDLVRSASNSQGPLAETIGLARQRRSHRQPRQRQRDRQAVARRASIARRADVGRHRQRLSAPGVVERGR